MSSFDSYDKRLTLINGKKPLDLYLSDYIDSCTPRAAATIGFYAALQEVFSDPEDSTLAKPYVPETGALKRGHL